MARPEDDDLAFLENLIAVALDISDMADFLIYETDEPETVGVGVRVKMAALAQQGAALDFRPRLEQLKAIERKNRLTQKDEPAG